MSALPSPSHNQHGSNDAAADPSMEEILASIRRIIADDHGTPINPRPSRAAPPSIAEASPSVAPAAPSTVFTPRADLPRPRPAEEIAPAETPRRPVIESLASRDYLPPLRPSEAPTSSVESMSERIARLESAPSVSRPVLRHTFDEPARPEPVAETAPEVEIAEPARLEPPAGMSDSLLSPLARASVTSAFEALTVSMSVQNTSMVEDAVRDMLRPMLKEWLDDNLPIIVERLVRAEIERVARGGRS